jgi:hypothetical protein
MSNYNIYQYECQDKKWKKLALYKKKYDYRLQSKRNNRLRNMSNKKSGEKDLTNYFFYGILALVLLEC